MDFYPDVIGEYIHAPVRYEANGLQYVSSFEPNSLAQSGLTNMILFLQNMLNTDIKVTVSLSIPGIGFRSQPVLAVKEEVLEVDLARAEVGLLIIPITTTDKAKAGQYDVGVQFDVAAPKAQALRRPNKSSPLPNKLIDDLVGLNIVGLMGIDYQRRKGQKNKFTLTITDETESGVSDTELAHSYQTLWTTDQVHGLIEAQKYVNEMRVTLLKDLQPEPVFIALYAESLQRFADLGVPLRVGEAIALGKILTYTTQYFLQQADLQNALLCPIWEQAIAHEVAGENPVNIIRVLGYEHIMRLAIALSFGLIGRSVGQQLWSKEERRGVTEFITDTFSEGLPLEIDFIYLPLLIAAASIANQVTMPDENTADSARLLHEAVQARPNLLTDPDMVQASKLLNSLLQAAMTG